MAAIQRREFLKTTAGYALFSTFACSSTRSMGRVLGANEAVGVGVVGLHGRGQTHLDMVSRVEGFRLAAVCDVDPAYLNREVENSVKRGHKVSGFADVRRLLDRKDIDAITIATPNHWHSLLGIWACQAGKDVYIEKPVSHNVWEGRQLVTAARRHARIVQTGTQARSNPDVREAVAWVRAGNLGKIKHARGMCYKPRMSIGKFGKGEVPAGLDYDLWTGPAPLKPLARKNLHYDWHWIYDYGNGDLGNQGIHEMDLARWLLGYATLSPRVMSIGGRFGYDDDGQTPNTQVVYHDYDGPPLVFEVRGLPKSKDLQRDSHSWSSGMDSPPGFTSGRTIGVICVCEGGRFFIDDGGETLAAEDVQGKTIRRFEKKETRFGAAWSKGDFHHFTNWLQAIRSRNRSDLTAEILEGHLSSALCHTGMISHRIGQTMSPGEVLERIGGNPFAAERFGSFREHLERNGVDLSKRRATLGPWLTMDPATERFPGCDSANHLLRRDDRKPFVVPEIAG